MIKNALKRAAAVAAAGLMITGGAAAFAAPNAHAAGDGKVTARPGVAVRYAPTARSSKVGSLEHGNVVPLSCKVTGSQHNGNRTWYQLPGDGGPEWIPGWHVRTSGQIPDCGNDERFVGRAIANVSIRKGPNTENHRSRVLHRGEGVDVRCKIFAQYIDGNRLWYWTTGGDWVSARYIENVGRAPNWCVEM